MFTADKTDPAIKHCAACGLTIRSSHPPEQCWHTCKASPVAVQRAEWTRTNPELMQRREELLSFVRVRRTKRFRFGDAIARLLSRLGVTEERYLVTKNAARMLVGLEPVHTCGCPARREKLNQLSEALVNRWRTLWE
jgi:hypothetical protein